MIPRSVPRRSLAVAAMAVTATLVAGCLGAVTHETPTPSPSSASASPTPPSVGPSVTPSSTSTPTPTPHATPSPTGAPTPIPTSAADCASTTLASLSVAQRVGQLFMLGLVDDRLDAAERAAVRDQHLGSMLFTATTTAGVDAVRAISDAVQAQATDEATGRVRFLVAANQEGGLIQALRGKGFQRIPSAVAQGRLDPTTLETDAVRWGRELLRAGVNVDLAPVADVVPAGTEDQNAPIGQLEREYGSDPALAAPHVAAFVKGLARGGVATSAKHFPGLGRVAGNTDHVANVVDETTTRDDPYLQPFGAAIRAGVPFVMVSLATYERIDPDHLAVFSPTVLQGMLRHDLGFKGVVLSDALGATAVKAILPGQRAIDYLLAGGDMIVIDQADQAVAMAKALTARAEADASFRQRLDQSTLRVLREKERLGLLPCP